MMQSSFSVLFLLLLLTADPVIAEPVTVADCRALEPVTHTESTPLAYSDGLLWKVSRKGIPPSYLFGTIHVGDPDIVDLPEPVSNRLHAADVLVLEALPEPEEALRFSQMMLFTDGRTLRDFIGETLFERTTAALQARQFPPDSVMLMKPWAAFLIMNYPANNGLPLDLALLDIARQKNIKVHGLETLTEQGEVFSTLELDQQVQFLLDTICNYETVERDFEEMKRLYRERDLEKLYTYSNRYSLSEEAIYRDLVKRLLVDRNRIMATRMQEILEQGNAFIAIGAIHLPGEDGVLSLLARQGYTITSVY